MEDAKKNKTIKILEIVVLVLLVALLGAIVYKQYIAKDDGKDTPKPTTNETAKLSDTDKNNILLVLGLKDNGYPKEIHLDVPANADLNPYNFQAIMLDVKKTGDIKLDDLSNDELEKIIYGYAKSSSLTGNVSGSEYEHCEAGQGSCESLSFDNYSNITALYGITKDGKALFTEDNIYKTNYLFTFSGYFLEPVTITDNITFEEGKDLVKVIYDIKVENTDNAVTNNKTFTYTFKKDNGEYVITNINIKDNLAVDYGDVPTESTESNE